jgi:hypothetical protein
MISFRTSKAQALLEFALVIVLMLVLILGVIEVARVLFIYASTVTSSREAVRHGSVAGQNDAGVLFYQDCAGIRNTARKFDFFRNMRDSDIVIQYDKGPGTSVFDTCDNAVDLSVAVSPGDRVLVTITARYSPIIPLVPLTNRNIVVSSARTIVGTITFEEP